jgi:hypothetical protein
MKAILSHSGEAQLLLTLRPENAEEESAVREFGLRTSRAHIINCRGFQYMQSEVEFLVQPMSTGD